MSIVMTTTRVIIDKRRKLTFQILRSIESLLLLKQEGIAHERKPTNSLTMRSEEMNTFQPPCRGNEVVHI